MGQASLRSLDTNIVVRAIVRDSPSQASEADRVLLEPALLTITVVLETMWVLKSSAGLSATAAVTGLRDILDLPELVVQNRAEINWALQRYETGADFADMLHLALSEPANSFITFDQGVERHARGSPVPVETLK